MAKRATVDDFPIGCIVRVARFPRSRSWLQKYVGLVATVHSIYDAHGGWVNLSYGPVGGTANLTVRPWWLERGRVAWIPEIADAEPA